MTTYLNWIVLYLFLCFSGSCLLWVLYIASMDLRAAYYAKMLTPASKVLGYPTLLVGLVVDVLVNLVVCTVFLLELPQEYTVTARIQRLVLSLGWRQKICLWIAVNLLNSVSGKGTPHVDLSKVLGA